MIESQSLASLNLKDHYVLSIEVQHRAAVEDVPRKHASNRVMCSPEKEGFFDA